MTRTGRRAGARRTFSTLAALVATTLLGATAWGQDRPSYHGYYVEGLSLARAAGFVDGQGSVTAWDARRGVPTFLWAPRGTFAPPGAMPERAARAHLARYAPLYGLAPADLAAATLAEVHDTGRGGILVRLEQELLGVPIFQTAAKILMRRDLELVAIGGNLHTVAEASIDAFARPATRAVAAALHDLYDLKSADAALVPEPISTVAGYQRFGWAPAPETPEAGLRFSQPARARAVWFPLPDRLEPAHYVEVFAGPPDSRESAFYAYVFSARDGRLLYRQNLTASDSYAYRVWADGTGDRRPLDGPTADFTPHPTGVPDGSAPPFIAPVLVAIDGFNATADPWLPANATASAGNNVDAYTDYTGGDGFSSGDIRAVPSAPGTFDYVYDTAADPLASTDQSMAAVTQLFFTTNWLHDYWYDSGFDEGAGNAQVDNYGRGGFEADRLHVEAQDSALDGPLDNANMATPADGASPRMQMYLWHGKTSATVGLAPLGQTLNAATAEFGPASFDVTADVALADDGVGNGSDACQTITNDLSGKIALVDRGTCSFESKAIAVQAAGAVGMVLANNVAGQPAPNMPGAGLPTPVTIAVLAITYEQGVAAKAALGGGPLSATLSRQGEAVRDGDLDNLIVAHEWGHYLHHRLVDCTIQQCGGQSEGWGDFVGLMTSIRQGDDLGATFAASGYAAGASSNGAYFGVRRYPYSVDQSKDPLTFRHIEDGAVLPAGVPNADSGIWNSEVHNTGEVWATMMFEGYARLLEQTQGASPPYSFDEGRRRMADYVVLGMKLASGDPTFTEQRDGILAAALASDEPDALLLADAFARRGAGSCAVSPAKDAEGNAGVVESFEVRPQLVVSSIALAEATTCDGDGQLDAEETATLVVELENRGAVPTTGGTVSLATGEAEVGAQPSSFDVPPLEPYATTTVSFTLAAAKTIAGPLGVALTLTVDSAESCEAHTTVEQAVRVDYDNAPDASATDGFESDIDVWATMGGGASSLWRREIGTDFARVWHGVDYSTFSDTSLVSPSLLVGAEPLVVTFRHRHDFESSQGTDWDGGVVELNVDGGGWQDVSSVADAGYGGTLSSDAGNPLAGRPAFVGKSSAWPDFDSVSLDLGSGLAGREVRLRFRIGTDQAVGAWGWEIDQVGFEGIVGTPFPAVVHDASTCGSLPVADAGADREVPGGSTAMLDASASYDDDGDPLAFTWTQTEGPDVTLAMSEVGGPTASFLAPEVEVPTRLAFSVRVVAADGEDTDTVELLVVPVFHVEPAGGCSCAVPGGDRRAGPLGWLAAAALGVAGASRRRRRRF